MCLVEKSAEPRAIFKYFETRNRLRSTRKYSLRSKIIVAFGFESRDSENEDPTPEFENAIV